jgi:hypothetical protein
LILALAAPLRFPALPALFSKLKDILKGKDGTILRLESRIKALQTENEVLRTEQ